jgi:hypothetical protein
MLFATQAVVGSAAWLSGGLNQTFDYALAQLIG